MYIYNRTVVSWLTIVGQSCLDLEFRLTVMSNNDHVALGATRHPLVLPDIFSRDSDINEWIGHFESVAVVNSWDDKSKLQWLRICMTGKARVMLTTLSEETYEWVKELLRECFDPPRK